MDLERERRARLVLPPPMDLTRLIVPVDLVSSTRRWTKSFQSFSLAEISGCRWAVPLVHDREVDKIGEGEGGRQGVPGTQRSRAASESTPTSRRSL